MPPIPENTFESKLSHSAVSRRVRSVESSVRHGGFVEVAQKNAAS